MSKSNNNYLIFLIFLSILLIFGYIIYNKNVKENFDVDNIYTGHVKFFNETKGFGFIVDDKTGIEYFVHVTGLVDKPIKENDYVKFDLQDGKKKGLNAVNVKFT